MRKHTLIILDRSGDTRYEWSLPEDGGVATLDAETERAIAEATAAFAKAKEVGYVAFETSTAAPEKGTIVKKFRPEAERTTMVPQYVGG